MGIRELKKSARASLKGNWGLAIGAFVINLIISGVITIPLNQLNPEAMGYSFLSLCINIFVTIPLQVGITWFYLEIYDRTNPEITHIFNGFRRYWKVIGASLLMGLFIFLWSLLLIIPGIIKAISYSQTLYIIKENPDIGVREAITESKRMMKGYKGKYFLTILSFIGWVLVPIIAMIIAPFLLFNGLMIDNGEIIGSSANLGVGLMLLLLSVIYTLGISFYLTPYYQTTLAGFYRELVNQTEDTTTLI